MKIGIAGAWSFGSAMASLLLKNGHEVTISDKNETALKACMQNTSSLLAQMAKQNIISSVDRELLMQKIKESAEPVIHKDADMIIEAVGERLQAKKDALAAIEAVARPDALIATVTSSIPVDALAKTLKNQERFIGIYTINPLASGVVEIISGRLTSPKTKRAARNLLEKTFKVIIETDSVPWLSRMVFGMINEAAYCVRDGATAESVDTLMKGMSSVGPLELADQIGLDTVLDVLSNLRNKSDKFRPCPLLSQMVREGKLGRKSGNGFYEYMK